MFCKIKNKKSEDHLEQYLFLREYLNSVINDINMIR
jgi:hypothetical protein